MIDMNESRLTSIKQLRAFLDGTVEVEFRRFADAERYEHIVSVLCRFRYAGLKRVEKGVVLRYLMHTTGYSRQQVTRLVRQYRSRGCLRKNYQTPAHGSPGNSPPRTVRCWPRPTACTAPSRGLRPSGCCNGPSRFLGIGAMRG